MRKSSGRVVGQSVKNARVKLSELPDKPLTERTNITLKETVRELSREISGSLGKGYTYKEIADKLVANGVKISSATLSFYHRQTIREGALEKKGTESAFITTSAKAKKAPKQATQKPATPATAAKPGPKVKQVKVVAKPAAKPSKTTGKPEVFKQIEAQNKRRGRPSLKTA